MDGTRQTLYRAAGRVVLAREFDKNPNLLKKALGFMVLAEFIDEHGDPAIVLSEARKVLGIEEE